MSQEMNTSNDLLINDFDCENQFKFFILKLPEQIRLFIQVFSLQVRKCNYHFLISQTKRLKDFLLNCVVFIIRFLFPTQILILKINLLWFLPYSSIIKNCFYCFPAFDSPISFYFILQVFSFQTASLSSFIQACFFIQVRCSSIQRSLSAIIYLPIWMLDLRYYYIVIEFLLYFLAFLIYFYPLFESI